MGDLEKISCFPESLLTFQNLFWYCKFNKNFNACWHSWAMCSVYFDKLSWGTGLQRRDLPLWKLSWAMDCPQAYIIVILVNQVPAQTTITLGGILFGSFIPPPSLGSMQHEDISLWFVPSSKKIISMHAQSLSCVPLFGTSWTVAHQAPLSMGFPRQEYWSGLLFPTPGGLPDLHLLHLLHG